MLARRSASQFSERNTRQYLSTLAQLLTPPNPCPAPPSIYRREKPAKMSVEAEMSPLSTNAPLSLDEAARVLLRGLVKASTLRAAIGRGELQAEFTGKRYITTPADIEAWRKLCRDRARERGCISGAQGEPQAQPNGSSETEQSRLALDAAKAIAKALKGGSRTTSPKNTGRPEASVHYLKRGSQT